MRLGVLLLIAVHLPLLRTELSHTEKPSSISGRGKVKPTEALKPTPCEKDCEDRTNVQKRNTQGIEHSTPKRSTPGTESRTAKKSMLGTNGETTKRSKAGSKQRNPKKSKQGTKCELHYFVPTAKHTDDAFFVWNNTKAEQLKAYSKIVPFLKANLHENKTVFFPAHLPLVEELNGIEVLFLKDVYVRAKGTCGNMEEHGPDYYDTKSDWFMDRFLGQQEKLRMLEDYVQRIPRSHFGYRVPKTGENDVSLDETGLVVKEFPGIRTCFSMWIYDDKDQKPKHFAGRQIYNRINQTLYVNASKIGFDRTAGNSHAVPIGAEEFSLPALFLKEMCHVTNESRENSCAYWATNRFYVSLCCCYTERTDCAYKNYKFPTQEKPDDVAIRTCATGNYYLMKQFGGNPEPKNTSSLNLTVKQFVQEKTSSEFCKWSYTWDVSNATDVDDVLQVYLDASKQVTTPMRQCLDLAKDGTCCERSTVLCPMVPEQETESLNVECFCRDSEMCNKRHSYIEKGLVRKFRETPPCESHTAAEHLLSQTDVHKKPNTSETEGYMCPVFYNFAPPGRPNTFMQLVLQNNFIVPGYTDEHRLFQQDGCHLVEVEILEEGECSEQLFEPHSEWTLEVLMILICSVEGNPLGENRTSYPDAELKNTIAANLTAAKEAFPICKTGFESMDFESVSELVVNTSKLERFYDDRKNGTNDNITTAHCYVEVSLVYQKQYNFTFGAVSVDDMPLHESCHDSENATKCVRRSSTVSGEYEHLACCCRRNWTQPLDMCRDILLNQLKAQLRESVIAETSEEIMSELKEDPLTKCDDADGTDATDDFKRPCARNEGCYTGVHARDDSAITQHKKFGGCVSEYAPDAKKRNDVTSADKARAETEARFSRVCRLARNQDQCFAVLGTEDPSLPEDVKGPQIVCCCAGQRETAQKCAGSHKFGKKISDFDID